MFRNWGFLLGEIWVLLLLAALIGLLAGWIIWGRRSEVTVNAHDAGEADRLRTALSDCEARGKAQAGRLSALERELEDANGRIKTAELAAADARSDAARAAAAPAAAMPAPLMAAAPKAEPAPAPAAKAAPKAAAKPAAKAAEPKAPARPEALKAARGSKADDLKQIKGIGPKLEVLCNKLGFFHFDQIAAWTSAEIAWVDENLEGFKGRVTRDEWVKQAKILAAGGTTEFSKRVEDGDVY